MTSFAGLPIFHFFFFNLNYLIKLTKLPVSKGRKRGCI